MSSEHGVSSVQESSADRHAETGPPPWSARAHLFAAAGLLHDCGKLLEPAGVPLPAGVERMQEQICPVRDGRSTHRHVLYSLLGVEHRTAAWGGLHAGQLRDLVAYHHRPRTGEQGDAIMVAADCLASGHDRRARDAAADPAGRVTALRPVLASVSLNKSRRAKHDPSAWHVPARVLDFTDPDTFLPAEGESSIDAYRASCRGLADHFLAAIRVFEAPSDEACVEHLSALMQRLTHAIPQSRSQDEVPDTSLYDHSRVVAAFAAAMAVQFRDGGPDDPDQVRAQARFRLFHFRIRSIQDFIFRILPPLEEPGIEAVRGERGLAKTLRARSFYLSLLTCAIARRTLHACGLPITNLLIDAGGRGSILLPDDPAVITRLRAVLKDVRAWVRRTLLGTAQVDLMLGDSLAADAFAPERFSATWDREQRLLESARIRPPFDGLAASDGRWSDSGWIERTANGLPVDRAEMHVKFRTLGTALPRAQTLVIGRTGQSVEGASVNLNVAGISCALHDLPPHRVHVPDGMLAFAIDLPSDDPRDPAALARPFIIIANHVPIAGEEELHALEMRDRHQAEAGETDETAADDDDDRARAGQPLTFGHLARLSRRALDETPDQDPGFHAHAMLGSLKADVDSLGKIMSRGLAHGPGGASARSIGRMCGLSRSLDLFFKGFLQARLRSEFPRVYTVFAGGDDLFLIGPWLDVIRLAKRLNDWFTRFACGNPDVTISAGVILTHPAAPVRALAHDGEEAVERSKGSGKNRITIGSLTMGWEDWQEGLALAGTLIRNEAGCLPAQLYRFYRFGRMAAEVEARQGRESARQKHASRGHACEDDEKPLPADAFRWRSQMSYDLRRNLVFDPKKVEEREPQACARQALHMRLTGQQGRKLAGGGALQVGAMLAIYAQRGEPRKTQNHDESAISGRR